MKHSAIDSCLLSIFQAYRRSSCRRCQVPVTTFVRQDERRQDRNLCAARGVHILHNETRDEDLGPWDDIHIGTKV